MVLYSYSLRLSPLSFRTPTSSIIAQPSAVWPRGSKPQGRFAGEAQNNGCQISYFRIVASRGRAQVAGRAFGTRTSQLEKNNCLFQLRSSETRPDLISKQLIQPVERSHQHHYCHTVRYFLAVTAVTPLGDDSHTLLRRKARFSRDPVCSKSRAFSHF